MTTTIALSENSHKELVMLKLDEGYKNMDEVVHQLIREHKKNKLIISSLKVRSRMDKLNLSLSDLIE